MYVKVDRHESKGGDVPACLHEQQDLANQEIAMFAFEESKVFRGGSHAEVGANRRDHQIVDDQQFPKLIRRVAWLDQEGTSCQVLR